MFSHVVSRGAHLQNLTVRYAENWRFWGNAPAGYNGGICVRALYMQKKKAEETP
jgi:hypothetical protein